MPEDGCVICGATWGNYWREIQSQRMFFCCEICADEFENMVNEIQRRTGWHGIDEVKIEGDQRGRNCVAVSGSNKYSFFIRFDSEGKIEAFSEHSP